MLVFEENQLEVNTYLALRDAVGWKKLRKKQAQIALEHSLYIVVALENGQPVGMGRLVGDGAVICYIQDLIVAPKHQGQKIGSQIIERLIGEARKMQLPRTELMLDLMCAKGREQFYQHHGFIARPTETLGPGMIQYLKED